MIYYDKTKKPLTDLSFNVDAPIGSMSWWCFKKIPKGWKLCDGSELSINQYTKLYQVIGNIYGEASDNEHFVLPNMDGRYLEEATLDENGVPEIQYKEPSAPDFDARFGWPNIWQSGNTASGAFYNAASYSWTGYKSGITTTYKSRSISVNFANDVNHGSIYARDAVIIPHKNVYIIIKAENLLDQEKLLDNVEVVL